MNGAFNGISLLDWILIIAFFILFLVSIYLIFLVFINVRKAGKFMFAIKDIKYKNQVLILGGILIIIIFSCFQYIKKPDMGSLLAISMLIMMFCANVVLQYFGIGICENGIMFGGVLHTWNKVSTFNFSNNLLLMNIQSKKSSNEFIYRFYINNTKKYEVEVFLNAKIKNNLF